MIETPVNVIDTVDQDVSAFEVEGLQQLNDLQLSLVGGGQASMAFF
jgi:hypothetical protein